MERPIRVKKTILAALLACAASMVTPRVAALMPYAGEWHEVIADQGEGLTAWRAFASVDLVVGGKRSSSGPLPYIINGRPMMPINHILALLGNPVPTLQLSPGQTEVDTTNGPVQLRWPVMQINGVPYIMVRDVEATTAGRLLVYYPSYPTMVVVRQANEVAAVEELVSEAFKVSTQFPDRWELTRGSVPIGFIPFPLREPGERLYGNLYITSANERFIRLEGELVVGFNDPERELLGFTAQEDLLAIAVTIDTVTRRYTDITYRYQDSSEKRIELVWLYR